MGDNFNEIGIDTLPVHNVYVSGFFLDKFEVTKEIWQAVQVWSTTHGYSLPVGVYKANGHPVVDVSWFTAVIWCNARSEKEGLTPCYYTDGAQTLVYRTGSPTLDNTMVKRSANGYRLPTESEWEKAARGGALGYRYPWGNTIAGSQANYTGSGDIFEGTGSPNTTPVGYYNGNQTPAGVDMPNGFGLYDIAGNVWEWCWDSYGSTYYGDATANDDPRGPSPGTNRILRGGTWIYDTDLLRCALRKASSSGNAYYLASGTPIYKVIGLRCARGL